MRNQFKPSGYSQTDIVMLLDQDMNCYEVLKDSAPALAEEFLAEAQIIWNALWHFFYLI